MMSVYVLRLVSAALADGRVVGQLESVETGERRVVRTLQELGDQLCAAGSGADVGPGPFDPAPSEG